MERDEAPPDDHSDHYGSVTKVLYLSEDRTEETEWKKSVKQQNS